MTEGHENTPEEDEAVREAAAAAAARQVEYEDNTYSYWALSPVGTIVATSEEGAVQMTQYDDYICFAAELSPPVDDPVIE